MDGIKIESFSLGRFFTNTYFVLNLKEKKIVIIDAPSGISSIVSKFEKKGFAPLFVLLTHAHIDHIEGLKEIKLPFYLHPQDKEFLHNPNLNLSSLLGSPLVIDNSPLFLKDKIEIGRDYFFEVIHTPGHTPGSVSFKLNNYLFCGDTLFFDSIGRTDIPLADYNLLLKSLKEKIITLDKDIFIFPGHGPFTTLGRELENNPFLKE